MLELTAIAPDIYILFIVGHFLKRNRRIEVADVEWVYTLFKGHTFYIQKTFNEAFADTPEGEICTLEMIRAAINNMIAANDTIFREILSNIPEKQKELLKFTVINPFFYRRNLVFQKGAQKQRD